MTEIKLSEKYIREKLRSAVKDKAYWKDVGDKYKEGISEGKILIYESLLSEIKAGVDEII